MSAHEGFHVDLESLTAFSEELTTQLSGMGVPIDHLQTLVGDRLEFGAFSEAKLLFHNHDTAAEKMSTLVGQAREAIGFAEEITKSVHSSYDHFDDEYNAKINAAGGIGGVVDTVTGSITGTVDGLTDGISGTVDGLTDGITGTVDGLTGGITGTVDGLTGGITGTVDGLTGGITGTVDGLTDGITGTVDGLAHGVTDNLGDTLGGTGLLSPLLGNHDMTGNSGVDIIGALTGDQQKTTGGAGA